MLNPILHFLQQVVTLRGTYNWSYVWDYFFASDILQGVVITIVLSVIAQFLGSVIGLLLYFLRRSKQGWIRALAIAYITVFRGTPLLVQILFLYAFLPYVGLARPLIATNLFAHLGFTNQIPLDAFLSGCVALALNEGAYMAEIVRAGIDSIDVGQLEAARSLGMTYALAMRRIVLPQALRVIVPPLGNEFNSMLKSSSLVSVISVGELLESAQSRAAALASPLELLTIAGIWYLILTSIWALIQASIERRLNASNIEPGSRKGLRWRTTWRNRAFGWKLPHSGSIGGAEGVPEVLGERR
ncbi:MAG: amino acid ABC transporter permease [Ktedonobacterales bacterium]